MTSRKLRVVIALSVVHMTRWRVWRVGALAVATAAVLGMRACFAEDFKAPSLDELKPMLRIEWRLGPDYPMEIQDSTVGSVGGKIVSAGGFTRHPLDICKQYPDAFGGQPSGFTRLTFVFDPKNESAGWKRIADVPGPPRQSAAIAVVDNKLYAMGGINYTFAQVNSVLLSDEDVSHRVGSRATVDAGFDRVWEMRFPGRKSERMWYYSIRRSVWLGLSVREKGRR